MKKIAITCLTIAIILLGCSTIPNSGMGNQSVEIMATGSGVTPDDALKSALFNAIREVTGEMMMGQDDLINYTLVQKSFSYSDGVITTYKLISSNKNNFGIYTTVVRATVNKSRLTTFLSSSISSSRVDGGGMYAYGVTAYAKTENQKKIIDEFTRKFYSEGLDIKILNQELDSKPNYLFVTINASVSVKPEFVSNFQNVMQVIGVSTSHYYNEQPIYRFYGLGGAQGTYAIRIDLLDKSNRLIKKFCGFYAFPKLVEFHVPISFSYPPKKETISFSKQTQKFQFTFQVDEVTQGGYPGVDHLEKLNQLKLLDKIKMQIDFSCVN